MFQLNYANAEKLPVFPDSLTVNTSQRYVNRMDLLERAYFNANLTINLLTYIVPNKGGHTGDLAHLYLQFTSSLLATSVYDTSAITYPKTYTVYSNFYGLNLGLRTQRIPYTNVPLRCELHFETFLLYAANNAINSDLNFQYNNRREFLQPRNSQKGLTSPIQPFWHIDALLMYNTSSKPENGSNIFLHYSYYSNYASITSRHYSTNYMQFQIGYAVDLGALFPKKKEES